MPKIHWESTPTVSEEGRLANSKVTDTFSLPKHRGAGRLAVVGGGPSIRHHIEELRNWDGTVWAINGTIKWCVENGVDAWFYTADAMPVHNWPYLSCVRKAVLAPGVCPDLVRSLMNQGAEVTLTHQVQSGPTSANATDFLAPECGYRHITYFGCEGSFEDKTSHAFQCAPIEDWVMVEVRGEYYKTKAEFLSQSMMLANILREFPTVYSERSGGLLRAMVEHGFEYDIPMVATTLFHKLKDRPDPSLHDETMLALIEHDMMAEAAKQAAE